MFWTWAFVYFQIIALAKCSYINQIKDLPRCSSTKIYNSSYNDNIEFNFILYGRLYHDLLPENVSSFETERITFDEHFCNGDDTEIVLIKTEDDFKLYRRVAGKTRPL